MNIMPTAGASLLIAIVFLSGDILFGIGLIGVFLLGAASQVGVDG